MSLLVDVFFSYLHVVTASLLLSMIFSLCQILKNKTHQIKGCKKTLLTGVLIRFLLIRLLILSTKDAVYMINSII